MDRFAMVVGYVVVYVAVAAFALLMLLTLVHLFKSFIFLHRLSKSSIKWKTRNPFAKFWYAFTFDADCVNTEGKNVFFPGREWK